MRMVPSNSVRDRSSIILGYCCVQPYLSRSVNHSACEDDRLLSIFLALHCLLVRSTKGVSRSNILPLRDQSAMFLAKPQEAKQPVSCVSLCSHLHGVALEDATMMNLLPSFVRRKLMLQVVPASSVRLLSLYSTMITVYLFAEHSETLDLDSLTKTLSI